MAIFVCQNCGKRLYSDNNAPTVCSCGCLLELEVETPGAEANVTQTPKQSRKPSHPVAGYLRFLAGLIIACCVIGIVIALSSESFVAAAIIIFACLFSCASFYAIAAIIDLLQDIKDKMN